MFFNFQESKNQSRKYFVVCFRMVQKGKFCQKFQKPKMILSQNNIEYLFTSILCQEKLLIPQKLSMIGFQCFKKYFYWYNCDQDRLKKFNSKYIVVSENLVGEDILWKISVSSIYNSVREEAIILLIELILSPINRKNKIGKISLIPGFLSNCFEQLTKENLEGIRMSLKALDIIIDKTEFGIPESINPKEFSS